jgi:hypothetical protein
MITQIIFTLQVYTIAGGLIRPCSEHTLSARVVFFVCESDFDDL